ncbi:MAG: hypothetical protein JW821_04230, partial [Deltaproteobacteria bacterium]|nr:hypothetical protein [Deltaproteobacteria bacterium]
MLKRHHSLHLLMGFLVFGGLVLTRLHGYLLFHSIAEGFSIVVACGIFMVAWNTRRILDNNYLLFVGIAYLFVAFLDFIHTLAYKGMGVFPAFGADLPTQIWIGARYMESFSLLLAPLFLDKRLRAGWLLGMYCAATAVFLASLFHWGVFPECFVEGEGLTGFKRGSEYLISMILAASALLLYRRRDQFDPGVFHMLVASILITIGSELFFTFYVHVYDLSNLIGHFLKIISFYLIYRAIIETGLAKPYKLLFRNLKQSEEKIRENARLNEILLDSLPHPTMLIAKDRRILAANRQAKEAGAEIGGYCWRTFGQGDYIPEDQKTHIAAHQEVPPGGTKCLFCLADEALETG